ncbi:hypothetical protein BT93_C1872 [Corymbia citriodora subsp. variegata]|nr:hypothetical protein BT93_C1872 [Corymbia citriodora subsp. variegata]
MAQPHEPASGDLDLDCLRLLWLRWGQLLHRDRQHTVVAHRGYSLGVGVLRQHELPHELADPPLHPQVLGPLLLLLPLPLAADDQHVVVLDLDLDVAGLQPRHIDDEGIGPGGLLNVGGGGGHGPGVADVGAGGGVEGLLGLVGGVHQVVQGGEERGLEAGHPEIHRRNPPALLLLGR